MADSPIVFTCTPASLATRLAYQSTEDGAAPVGVILTVEGGALLHVTFTFADGTVHKTAVPCEVSEALTRALGSLTAAQLDRVLDRREAEHADTTRIPRHRSQVEDALNRPG